jgi:parallel beta-helix repeat protein
MVSILSATRIRVASCLIACSSLLISVSAFAQGSLTPPGAPAPTMKTLTQIEPRTPISGPLPFSIGSPGSYYLTTNLTGAGGQSGISINANNVTLDLNGFALTGVPGSINGITFGGVVPTNVTVLNGVVSGWSGSGVNESASNGRNIVFKHLFISGNGSDGIFCTGQARVLNCLCASNVTTGIYIQAGGEITDCEVNENGNIGIFAVRCALRNCRVAGNGNIGVYLSGGTVSGCLVQSNVQSGIYLDSSAGAEVIGNTCIGNNTIASGSQAGIYINDNNSRVEANHVAASGFAGIQVNAANTNNIVIKNSVSGNGANNFLTPGNQVVGPLITTYGTITNSNPWANFSF